MENMEDYQIQCGEAYLTLKGNIIFHCTLCENRYKSFQEYANHVATEHYVPTMKEETKFIDFCRIISPTSQPLDENDFNSEGDALENVKMSIKDFSEVVSHALDETEFEFAEIKNRANEIYVDTKKCSVELSEKLEDNTKGAIVNIPEECSISSIKTIPSECSRKKKHKCTECNYSTKFKAKLLDHVRRHFGERPYKCTECCSQFYRPTDLNKHSRKHISSTTKSIAKLKSNESESKRPVLQSQKDVPSITTTDDGKFQCTACWYVSKEKANMWSHVKRHSAHKPHQCSDCAKSFYTRTELDTHIRSHTGEKPYLCTECGQAFTTSGKLSQHIKKHANIRDKQCSECSMKFFNLNLLKNHMIVHSEVRPHTCHICNACFKQRKALINHMKLHENKREFECHVCPAKFNQRPGLISHMKSKHSMIGDTNVEGT